MTTSRATSDRAPAEKNVAVNRKASHDYEIVRRVEAGISLTGSEIKSIRAGKISLQEAYVRPSGGDLWLLGAHISPYEAASYLGHEPRRDRRLLLHRAEIRDLSHDVEAGGLTLIPLRMYL